MCDACSRGGSGKCGSAGIGEQVQDLDRTSGIFDLITEPVPVCGLFRKKAGMFKAEWFQVECQILILNRPLLWQMEKFPFTAALFAAVIMSVFFLPAGVDFRCSSFSPSEVSSTS